MGTTNVNDPSRRITGDQGAEFADLIEAAAKLICETNEIERRWFYIGRAEKDRRRREAAAVISLVLQATGSTLRTPVVNL